MRWRSTFWLVGGAVVLFAYIWLFERHQLSTDQRTGSQPLLSGFRLKEIDSVQIQRTNTFLLRVQRTNSAWRYVAPSEYPAQTAAVETLLELAMSLNRDFLISESLERGGSGVTNHFGLDVPSAVLTLVQDNFRAELRLGDKTLSKEQVYAQLVGSPGVYAVPARLLDSLPISPNGWRETYLIHWAGLQFDRIGVSNAARGFTLAYERTNGGFGLIKPFQARANNERVRQLLVNLGSTQVAGFVNDSPSGMLDLYGLQPPVLELTVGLDTNQLGSVQFGSSPTNDPALVYARLSLHNNIVLVPRTALEQLQLSFVDLRDNRLVPFPVDGADTLEIRGTESFTAHRQGTNEWIIQPGGLTADAQLMREVLSDLSRLQIAEFSKDFVTDFTPFGLVPPAYSWVVRGTITNAPNSVTNGLLAHLDLGGATDQKVFARRPDESSVYAISLADAVKLPDATWKLRDRKIWSFSTNDVVLVTVEQDGKKVQLQRTPEANWLVVNGPPRYMIPNTFSIEETVHRLSRLRASVWAARGATNRTALGFTETGHRISVDTKREGKSASFSVEFGGRAPSRYTYAEVQLEGESWFFEFPLEVYFAVVRDLSISRISFP